MNEEDFKMRTFELVADGKDADLETSEMGKWLALAVFSVVTDDDVSDFKIDDTLE